MAGFALSLGARFARPIMGAYFMHEPNGRHRSRTGPSVVPTSSGRAAAHEGPPNSRRGTAHHGVVPLAATKAPLGPSGGAVASWTMTRASGFSRGPPVEKQLLA